MFSKFLDPQNDDELDRFRWNETEMLTYDQADLQEKVYTGALEQKFDEGFDKGIEKGRAEGMEEAQDKIIEGLLKQNLGDSVICTAANIPVEKLRLLKERIKKRSD